MVKQLVCLAMTVALIVLGRSAGRAQTTAPADLTGKWSGTQVVTMDGKPYKTNTLLIALKQTGTTLTGTAGPNENQQDEATIKGTVETLKKDGKDVTQVTLDVTPDGDTRSLRFVMTLTSGRLTGKAEGEMLDHKMTAVLDLTRSK